MNMFFDVRWRLCPFVKTRLMLCWWIIRYGGKKRIPKEVVVRALTKSVDRLVQNVAKARNAIPLEEMTEEDRLQLRELGMKTMELKGCVDDTFSNSRE